MKIKEVPLPDVWRTCNKIRAAIFRTGLNLYDYFKPLDPNNNCLISENQFVSVLGRQVRNLIGLSDQEISELADYFKVQDGRIFYTQFCEVIHKSVPDFSKNDPLASGLEWEDPLHENNLGPAEERKVDILITKIAALVNKRQLVLRPFFQDYELISKNCGTITIAHFGRIFYFLGILLSTDDFNLLVKKYVKNSYTINYNSFLAKIEAIQQFWEKHGYTDIGGDLLDQFPGRLINAELPKLPRPEIGVVSAEDIFGFQKITHPVMEKQPPPEDLITVMKRIQKYALEYRIRTTDFFQPFDRLNCGKITCSQFRRGLDMMGVEGYQKLYLSESELWQIIVYYRDPNDSDRVCWRTFADDVDQVFTTKELEKWPEHKVVGQEQIQNLPRRCQAAWIEVEPEVRDLCEETLRRIRRKLTERKITLKPCLRDYDKNNIGRVSKTQYRQCLLLHGILLADEEFYALERRFIDDLGFNYFAFLNELEAQTLIEPLYNEYVERKRQINCREPEEHSTVCETDIVMILGKIKAEVVRKRINICQYFKDHDPLHSKVILKCNFIRALDLCQVNLTKTEIETIMEVFQAPNRSDYIEYGNLVRTIEESFTIGDLERAPMIIPIPHYPSEADPRNFLNFNERQMVAIALEKLAVVPENNLNEVFSGFDKEHCGSVTKQQFVKALSVRNMVHLVSANERDVICKAFGFLRGLRDEVDYRAFLRALEILQVNLKKKPV